MNYKSILDNISEGVFTVDTGLRIQIFNSAAEKITGFPVEEVVGKHCWVADLL
jgi:PAS domain S-box-containing protein